MCLTIKLLIAHGWRSFMHLDGMQINRTCNVRYQHHGNEGTKEPPIINATKFLAEGFKEFGNDINKRKKNADDE